MNEVGGRASEINKKRSRTFLLRFYPTDNQCIFRLSYSNTPPR